MIAHLCSCPRIWKNYRCWCSSYSSLHSSVVTPWILRLSHLQTFCLLYPLPLVRYLPGHLRGTKGPVAMPTSGSVSEASDTEAAATIITCPLRSPSKTLSDNPNPKSAITALTLPRRLRTPPHLDPTPAWTTTLRPKRRWSWHRPQAQDSRSLRPRSLSTNDTSDSGVTSIDAHATPRAGDGADFAIDDIAFAAPAPVTVPQRGGRHQPL